MENIKKLFFHEKIIGAILILIIGTLFYRILKELVEKVMVRGKTSYEKKKRTTIIRLTTNVIKFFIYSIMIIMILDIYGVDTKSIIASLGIAGVVLGFALQETAQDFMSGISIIMDNYYVLGDIVTINGFTGEVIEMSLKSTKIKKVTGEVLIITNHNVNTVINLSQERAGVKIDIPTAYEEDTEKVEKVLKSIVEKAKKIPNVYADSQYLGMESLDDSSISYSIILYCKQSEQWNIKRLALKMIKEAYEKENIKIPYPQIEVHNGKESL